MPAHRPTGRSRPGCGPPRSSSSFAISRLCRRSSSSSPLLRACDRLVEPDVTLRIIRGGRKDDGDDGLLVVGAAEVVTMAGGLRRGPSQDDAGVLTAAAGRGPGGPNMPVVACWQGR